MPVVLYVLACAVFAQATSEFMLAGLVAPIAAELGVPLAAAGSLTSAFAVGMVIGAPIMAISARRLRPRTALVGFLLVFVVVHVVGALTSVFALLLVTRVLAALANAGFLAVALAVALRVVDADCTARATATLLAGTTLALIVGVPAGALLGQYLGWRATFWAVALISIPPLVGVLTGVPSQPDAQDVVPATRRELRCLRRAPVVLTLLVGALVNGATFAVYTYLSPLLTGAGRLDASAVPLGLVLFGLGAFVGVTMAGRLADRHYRRLVVVAGAGVLAGWIILGVLAGYGWVALGLLPVLGLLAFALGSTVIAGSLSLTPEAPTLGGSFTTAALNLGATLGPVLGGLALAASTRGPVWVAVGLVATAAVPGLIALRPPDPNPRLQRDSH